MGINAEYMGKKEKKKSKGDKDKQEKESKDRKPKEKTSKKRSRSESLVEEEPPKKIQKVEKESKVNTNPTPTDLSVQEKRKLLWGKKKQTEPKSNVWASANLGNDEQNKKLLKLMGVKNTDKIESTPKKNVLNPD